MKKGDTELCTKVNAAIKAMIADGSWQKAVDNNLGAASFKPGTGNPPKPGSLLLIDSTGSLGRRTHPAPGLHLTNGR